MKRLIPVVLAQIVGVLFGIISIKIISRFVSPEVYGPYSLFLTLTTLGALLTHSGLANHALRYWNRERPNGEFYIRYLWRKSCRVSIYLSLLILLLCAGLSLSLRSAQWIYVCPWLLASTWSLALLAIANGVLSSDERWWSVFYLGALGGLARTVFPIAMVLLAGATFFFLCSGFALHACVVFFGIVSCFYSLWKSGKSEPEKEEKWNQELIAYGRPYILMGVGGWLLVAADRWIVLHFFGDARTGLFALATNLGGVIPSIVISGMLQLVFARIFRMCDSAATIKEWQTIARRCDLFTGGFLAICVVGLAILAAAGHWLTGWLIDVKYSQAMPLILPAGLAAVTVQVNQFYYLMLQGQHDSANMVKVMLIVSGIKTALSIVAAALSWEIFMGWLVISTFTSAVLGRVLTRRMVFRRAEFLAGEKRVQPSNISA